MWVDKSVQISKALLQHFNIYTIVFIGTSSSRVVKRWTRELFDIVCFRGGGSSKPLSDYSQIKKVKARLQTET